MINLIESISIARPAHEVWAFVADYANDLRWRKGVTEMVPDPPGPPAVGTAVHEVVRKFGSTYTTASTVTEVGPGYRYRFSGTGDSGKIEGGRTVTETDPATATFTYDIALEIDGFMSYLSPLARRALTRGLRNDLLALRQLLSSSER